MNQSNTVCRLCPSVVFVFPASSIHLNLPEESSSDLSVARNFPVAILSLALALVGTLVAVLFGSLKPVLLTLGLVYLLLFGLNRLPRFWRHPDGRHTSEIGEDLLKATGLDAEECRTRAVCEITEVAVQRYPTVAAMLRSLSGAVRAQDCSKFVLKGLLGGLSGLGCESLYAICNRRNLIVFVFAATDM
ncbi:hypothetical protein HPB47_007807 [Ixodes persulcatus]|uniref:Uncharacterized protein n=1 Tax=Ixodes persulcatus TaxID=34615 RepID=A0AC60P6U5_IXOPE|nr:hypothetical protein HPB47_007807 [Ixodes persulcatus]